MKGTALPMPSIVGWASADGNPTVYTLAYDVGSGMAIVLRMDASGDWRKVTDVGEAAVAGAVLAKIQAMVVAEAVITAGVDGHPTVDFSRTIEAIMKAKRRHEKGPNPESN